MTIDSERFNGTIASFDATNAQDPNLQNVDGPKGLESRPKELVYAMRLSDMLNRYAPNASEALKLAARAQHIQRWVIPRADFPITKSGYMQWRGKLKTYHAEVASKIMLDHGYDETTIIKVCALLKKENLRTDTDMQILEDVIVLAFLEYDLTAFVQKHNDYSEEKLMTILRKSYLKMSTQGRQAALGLIKLPEHLLPIIQKAIA